jgi:hypothetical protein
VDVRSSPRLSEPVGKHIGKQRYDDARLRAAWHQIDERSSDTWFRNPARPAMGYRTMMLFPLRSALGDSRWMLLVSTILLSDAACAT